MLQSILSGRTAVGAASRKGGSAASVEQGDDGDDLVAGIVRELILNTRGESRMALQSSARGRCIRMATAFSGTDVVAVGARLICEQLADILEWGEDRTANCCPALGGGGRLRERERALLLP